MIELETPCHNNKKVTLLCSGYKAGLYNTESLLLKQYAEAQLPDDLVNPKSQIVNFVRENSQELRTLPTQQYI